MRIYRLNEARNKERFFNRHSKLTPKQKEELIKLYSEQYIPDDIIDWNKIESYSYDELYNIVNTFIKDREEKKNKKNLSRAIEGRDYIKIFENTNGNGTEYLYLPLTWIGSKYLASDHFLPKIKVPSKVMQARDFSDNTAENEDLSPGAKWCISLWTIPDYVIDGKPLKDEDGKEFRHEGKRYWLSYTSGGAYFLFYFRDYKGLKDISKKVALTLNQGSPKIVAITLANDNSGRKTPDIKRVQDYWYSHYHEYKSQIEHIQELSKKDKPEFDEYEKQKGEEAKEYLKSHIMDYLTYNESTGRYDSNSSLDSKILQNLVKDGEFTVPLGVINGNFACSELGLKTLKNGPTEVTGYLSCYNSSLISLEYAPKKVGGTFYCWGNKLTTLEGAPEYIGENFYCNGNKLTTLEYAPKEVGGDFKCSFNNLTTLKGAPNKIGRDFDCSNNKLTSLEYAPKYVGGYFRCSSNKLTTLKEAPEKVGGNFDCSRNKLTTLEGAPKYVGGDFECYRNNLTTLEGVPEYVGGDFYCGKNPLQSDELSSEVKGSILY